MNQTDNHNLPKEAFSSCLIHVWIFAKKTMFCSNKCFCSFRLFPVGSCSFDELGKEPNRPTVRENVKSFYMVHL